jgi:hypothetical protein
MKADKVIEVFKCIEEDLEEGDLEWSEMVKKALRYVSKDKTQKLWKSIDGYNEKDYVTFKESVLEHYLGCKKTAKHFLWQLEDITEENKSRWVTLWWLAAYHTSFLPIALWLEDSDVISKSEKNKYFWFGLPRSFQRLVFKKLDLDDEEVPAVKWALKVGYHLLEEELYDSRDGDCGEVLVAMDEEVPCSFESDGDEQVDLERNMDVVVIAGAREVDESDYEEELEKDISVEDECVPVANGEVSVAAEDVLAVFKDIWADVELSATDEVKDGKKNLELRVVGDDDVAQEILGYFNGTTGSVEEIEAMEMQGSADKEESKSARDGDILEPEDMPVPIKHPPAAIEDVPGLLKNVSGLLENASAAVKVALESGDYALAMKSDIPATYNNAPGHDDISIDYKTQLLGHKGIFIDHKNSPGSKQVWVVLEELSSLVQDLPCLQVGYRLLLINVFGPTCRVFTYIKVREKFNYTKTAIQRHTNIFDCFFKHPLSMPLIVPSVYPPDILDSVWLLSKFSSSVKLPQKRKNESRVLRNNVWPKERKLIGDSLGISESAVQNLPKLQVRKKVHLGKTTMHWHTRNLPCFFKCPLSMLLYISWNRLLGFLCHLWLLEGDCVLWDKEEPAIFFGGDGMELETKKESIQINGLPEVPAPSIAHSLQCITERTDKPPLILPTIRQWISTTIKQEAQTNNYLLKTNLPAFVYGIWSQESLSSAVEHVFWCQEHKWSSNLQILLSIKVIFASIITWKLSAANFEPVNIAYQC